MSKNSFLFSPSPEFPHDICCLIFFSATRVSKSVSLTFAGRRLSPSVELFLFACKQFKYYLRRKINCTRPLLCIVYGVRGIVTCFQQCWWSLMRISMMQLCNWNLSFSCSSTQYSRMHIKFVCLWEGHWFNLLLHGEDVNSCWMILHVCITKFHLWILVVE